METADRRYNYVQWRTEPGDRAEDAAYLFGYFLIKHCRDEALSKVDEDASPTAMAEVEKAVDTALHNVCDLLEGFWPLDAGPDRRAALVLGVQIRDAHDRVVETQEISPCKLDLPIGYWKWAHNREFR
jgi:hypothetical protein